MQAVRRGRRTSCGIEDPLLDHGQCPCCGLLRRLPHEHHVAAELLTALVQQPCGPDQRRDVQVVATRVHDALVFGGVRQPGLLEHRQCIHVTAQQDDRTRAAVPTPTQDCGDRRESLPGGDLERQPLQRIEYHAWVFGSWRSSSGTRCSLRRRSISSGAIARACSRRVSITALSPQRPGAVPPACCHEVPCSSRTVSSVATRWGGTSRRDAAGSPVAMASK